MKSLKLLVHPFTSVRCFDARSSLMTVILMIIFMVTTMTHGIYFIFFLHYSIYCYSQTTIIPSDFITNYNGCLYQHVSIYMSTDYIFNLPDLYQTLIYWRHNILFPTIYYIYKICK